jgi:ABC-type sugar transport system ATPase subunit
MAALSVVPNELPNSLVLSGVSQYYGAVQALDAVTLEIRSGAVTALVGHNGAGKSTVLRILSGATRPDSGSVFVDGRPIHLGRPSDALQAGISTVYQELTFVPHLSVAQNFYLGREVTRHGALSISDMLRGASSVCEEFGIDVDVRLPVRSLTVAQRQLAEVAAAASRRSRFLLLDEPTTALEAHQATKLLSTLREIATRRGVGVLLIDHKLDEVYSCADYIVGLTDGRKVLDGKAGLIRREDVVEAIVGRHETSTKAVVEREIVRGGKPRLAIRGLTTKRLRGVDLEVHPGEIVVLYGLMGSGRSSLVRTIAGLYRVGSDAMRIDGRRFRPRSIQDAMRHGVVLVPEERKLEGVFPNLDTGMNAGIGVLNSHSVAGVVQSGRLYRSVTAQLKLMKTRGDIRKPVLALSGGNQQKVLLARAFLRRPKVLLLDEPTKGVDIGAKVEIYELIRRLAQDSKTSIVAVTSEEEEAIALADRVVVIQDGQVAHDVAASTMTVPLLRKLAWLPPEQGREADRS